VVGRIERMPPDPSLADYVRKLQRVAGGTTRYWDLACALNLLARNLGPTRYLEIGVRRGKSMAQVAGQCPDCEIVGIDMWAQPYGGVTIQPGLRPQMGHWDTAPAEPCPATGHCLPSWSRHRNATTSSRSTSQRQARGSLVPSPLINDGGYLAFDDLTIPPTLAPVWNRFSTNIGN
jgi:hypothetical protein